MAELQLISSDSHVSEPPDLWMERLDTRYRDRAPRVVLNPAGQEGAYLVYEGYPPHNLAIGLGAGRTPDEKDVSAVEKRKIVRENAATLYGFDLG